MSTVLNKNQTAKQDIPLLVNTTGTPTATNLKIKSGDSFVINGDYWTAWDVYPVLYNNKKYYINSVYLLSSQKFVADKGIRLFDSLTNKKVNSNIKAGEVFFTNNVDSFNKKWGLYSVNYKGFNYLIVPYELVNNASFFIQLKPSHMVKSYSEVKPSIHFSDNGTNQTVTKESNPIPDILSSVGMLAGLYYAHTKKSHFWGYVGYAALGSLAFGIVGKIGVKIFVKPKSDSLSSTNNKSASIAQNSNQFPTNRTDAINAIYNQNITQGTKVTLDQLTKSVAPLSDQEVIAFYKFGYVFSNPDIKTAMAKAAPKTKDEANAVWAKFGISDADMVLGQQALTKANTYYDKKINK